MRCTLRQLQVFAAVARHKSYTRAAEELHLTQPAVFTQVKQLEDALGAVLLDRIGKRLFLTEAGQAVLATARETLEGIERLEMQLADLQGLRRGRLRLAIVSTAQYFLPRLLGAFCTENPGIEVALTVTNRQTVIARLAANEDDLCILGQPPEGLDVVARPIARNAILVLAPPGHPLVGVTAVPFAALAEAPFILREPGSGTRAAAEKFFAENGIRAAGADGTGLERGDQGGGGGGAGPGDPVAGHDHAGGRDRAACGAGCAGLSAAAGLERRISARQASVGGGQGLSGASGGGQRGPELTRRPPRLRKHRFHASPKPRSAVHRGVAVPQGKLNLPDFP
ncbi:LysR family transcriptional regulator [Rhodobacter capsulatus]